ncbi:MAG: hypothetical protein EBY80_12180 [Actinobacteria bacterium]|nr:hypothetical protein [Actinomycetota bacterium]
MSYKMQLKDLREVDGMYYIGDIVDMDGSPWVTKEFAEQTLDLVNSEVDQPIFEDLEDDLFDTEF